ncbi:GntR family transcriptional regulator [Acidisoma sp. C75]
MSISLALQTAAPRVTAAMAIYRALRAAILSLDLPPGAALLDRRLSDQFQVSRTPVREALIRLAEEGLVEIRPQSGTFVSRIQAEAIPEALDLRLALESMTVRRAAMAADAAAAARLARILAEQQAAATAEDAARFHVADEAFHEAIAEIAGRPAAWRLIQEVKQALDRARRLTLPAPGRMAQVMAEHGAIQAAIAAAKPGKAERRMADHLAALLPDIARLRAAYPAYFA